jgi:hypothetical protein
MFVLGKFSGKVQYFYARPLYCLLKDLALLAIREFLTSQFWYPILGKKGQPVKNKAKLEAGNTKGGSITVPLTSCLTGLELAV